MTIENMRIAIERKRQELFVLVDKEPIGAGSVLKVSQELDELLNQYMDLERQERIKKQKKI